VTVISDTSPLSALAEIGELGLLFRLFGSITIPEAVLAECRHPGAPEALRHWASQVPDWVLVDQAPRIVAVAARGLDPGEAAAISIALDSPAPVLILMDERAGVAVVQSLGLPFTGTLGILIRGHRLGFTDFEMALASLRRTRFRLSEAVIAHARRLLA
jgi:uncharacterized protein